MKRLLTPLLLLVLLLAACGSNTTEVTAGSDDGDDVSIPVEADGGIGDGAGPIPDEPDSDQPDSDEPTPNEPQNEQVITDFDPVDPKVVIPDSIELNPENPAELFVRFTGGDVNCTAATVNVLAENPDAVKIELLVGITSDALARSCLAGEFNLRIDVELSEDATGKTLAWGQSAIVDEPQLVTPDLTTQDFVGLTEAEAAALADENIITWRVVRVDDEFFAVTQDYSPGRMNFEIEDGKVAVVTLG